MVFITLGQRRIPTQSAKHVRGRRVYGGKRQYLPLRVNQAGVMPIIFASSLLMFPVADLHVAGQLRIPNGGLAGPTSESTACSPRHLVHLQRAVRGADLLLLLLLDGHHVQSQGHGRNLKNFGTFIPGYRPGKRTADYLEKVMVRITYVGAGFLALVAIMPTIVANMVNIDFQIASFYGGTGLLIAVSVASIWCRRSTVTW